MIRLFVGVLAVTLAPPMAMAAERHYERDARMTSQAVGDGGCGRGYHRGAGGNCILNPTKGPYRPDPYWTPCDYSLGPQYPEGCGF